MDIKQMASDLGIDDDDFMELVDLLVTTSLSDLDSLETGLEKGDADQVAKAAHSIKGASGNMGFMDLSAKASQVEADARAGRLEGVPEILSTLRQDLLELKKALGQ